jgi:hypothetical protein
VFTAYVFASPSLDLFAEICRKGWILFLLQKSFGFVFRFGKKLPQSNYREKALFFRYSK